MEGQLFLQEGQLGGCNLNRAHWNNCAFKVAQGTEKKAKKVKPDQVNPKKPLVMERNCIYSRAYHAAMVRSGNNKLLSRKKGNEAVQLWLAEA